MEKICDRCAEKYGAKKKDQRYCGVACMRRAKTERHRDKDNARRRNYYAVQRTSPKPYTPYKTKTRQVILQPPQPAVFAQDFSRNWEI